MNKAILFILLLCLSQKEQQLHQPLFFNMGKEYEQVEKSREIFTFSNLDTLIEHPVYLLSNQEDDPLLFYSRIVSPVCIDGQCKPMYIGIYWNLLGNYVGYNIVKDQPLSKYDHEEFEPADYLKLHQLLLDDKSILKRKKMSDLFDPSAKPDKAVKYKGVEVDGVSGATRKEIKASLVEGALYSCYTIWHLVHGEVNKKMEYFLKSTYTNKLEEYLLYSQYADYQFYAIKQLDAEGLEQHLDRIIALLENAPPLTRTYVMKKLPKELWKQKNTSALLYHAFSSFDINSKTLLIKKLPLAHPKGANILSRQIAAMSKNQLKFYLDFLEKDKAGLPEEIQKNLEECISSKQYAHDYLIRSFLEK